MFRLIKKECAVLFSRLIASMVKVSDHTNWISFNKRTCITRPNLVDINPDE